MRNPGDREIEYDAVHRIAIFIDSASGGFDQDGAAWEIYVLYAG